MTYGYKLEILPKDPEYPTHTSIRMSFLEPDSYRADSLLDWISRQDKGEGGIRKNFVYSVTAHYESHVVLQSRPSSGIPCLTHFIIRTYNENDLKWFLECWPYSPEEYEEEKKRLIELEARKQGHIVIDGKSYGISELAPISTLPEIKKPVPRVVSQKPEGTELVAFLKTMEIGPKGCPQIESYWVAPDPGYRDFNREVIAPNDDCPEGMIGIRTDDNFYIVATLPYRFLALTCEEIVAILWPNIVEESLFHNDADDEKYWAKYFQPMVDQQEKWKKERKKEKAEYKKMIERMNNDKKKKDAKVKKNRARWKKFVSK